MRRLFATLIVPIALAACSTPTDSGGGAIPTKTQLKELGAALTDEVESQVPAFTLGATQGFPSGVVPPGSCPTVSSNADADGDGILDDATFTFTNPPCEVTGFRGGTLALTGAIRIQDPNFASNTGYDLTLTDFAWTYTAPNGGISYTASRTGTRTRTGSSNALAVASTMTTERQRTDITALATIDHALAWSFTAANPGTIAVGQPLPNGSFTVSGSWHWQRSAENWNLTVSTASPLVYDAGCTGTSQRLKGGRLVLSGSVAGVPGSLWIDFTACDVRPTLTWVEGP